MISNDSRALGAGVVSMIAVDGRKLTLTSANTTYVR